MLQEHWQFWESWEHSRRTRSSGLCWEQQEYREPWGNGGVAGAQRNPGAAKCTGSTGRSRNNGNLGNPGSISTLQELRVLWEHKKRWAVLGEVKTLETPCGADGCARSMRKLGSTRRVGMLQQHRDALGTQGCF